MLTEAGEIIDVHAFLDDDCVLQKVPTFRHAWLDFVFAPEGCSLKRCCLYNGIGVIG